MPDVDLTALSRSFARLKARWARQGRRVRHLAAEADKIAKARSIGHLRGAKRQTAALETVREEVGYHSAWIRWSATADELDQVVAQILDYPASHLPDLVAKFEALLWLLLADGAVVDHDAELQLRRFGRELRQIGAAGHQVGER